MSSRRFRNECDKNTKSSGQEHKICSEFYRGAHDHKAIKQPARSMSRGSKTVFEKFLRDAIPEVSISTEYKMSVAIMLKIQLSL